MDVKALREGFVITLATIICAKLKLRHSGPTVPAGPPVTGLRPTHIYPLPLGRVQMGGAGGRPQAGSPRRYTAKITF